MTLLDFIFICEYGQSRSRYFAIKLMRKGYTAAFCGVNKDSDIKCTDNLLCGSKVAVFLDKGAYKEFQRQYPKFPCTNAIIFHIEDEPMLFNEKFSIFSKLLNKTD